MRVVVTIQHPGHVHFFRHAIRELDDRGHEVHVFTREKDVAVALLRAFDVPHTVLASETDGFADLVRTQLRYETRLLAHAHRLDPDVMTAVGGVAVSHVAPLVGARSVVFTDTEHATLINRLAFPFADAVYTPECFADDGVDAHEYPGYHELAYLHPRRFTPDPGVLADVDAAPDDRIVVLRLVSWGASHDVGKTGIDRRWTVAFVERLEDAGATVLVTAEGSLPDALARRRATVVPHHMHDLLAHADLFVGEGATMAAESAVLGTPAVYVNDLAMGYTDELEERYGLLAAVRGPNVRAETHARALEMLAESPSTWTRRRERLLAEKVDTTDVIVDALLDGATPDASAPPERPEPSLTR